MEQAPQRLAAHRPRGRAPRPRRCTSAARPSSSAACGRRSGSGSRARTRCRVTSMSPTDGSSGLNRRPLTVWMYGPGSSTARHCSVRSCDGRARENIELKTRRSRPGRDRAAHAARSAPRTGACSPSATPTSASSDGLLKLREDVDRGDGELIFYRRPRAAQLRSSRYWRARADDPEALARAARGRPRGAGVVEKRRRLYLYENVRIHLDDVRRARQLRRARERPRGTRRGVAGRGARARDRRRRARACDAPGDRRGLPGAQQAAMTGASARHSGRGIRSTPSIGAFVTTRRQTWSAPAARCCAMRPAIRSSGP